MANSTSANGGEDFYLMVTGANSGLGYAICARAMDEFFATRPPSATFHLIITTRDKKKGDGAVRQLRQHIRKLRAQIGGTLENRVVYHQEILDLTSLVSVHKLACKLNRELPRLDALIFNAGYGAWDGIDYLAAIRLMLKDYKAAVTWPPYKNTQIGRMAKPQLPMSTVIKEEEPALGEVFCANVFGHYLLGHSLSPLLSSCRPGQKTCGRMVWIGSLESYDHTFSLDDFQGLRTRWSYECSKRLTDILVLTAELPGSIRAVKQYVDYNDDHEKTPQPKLYVAHPGICATNIMPLPWFITFLIPIALLIARWLGSSWHPISPYKGACAPVWCALSPQEVLDEMEEAEGRGKWGSATNWFGSERVDRTEVEGWGWGGVPGERVRSLGRRPGVKNLTEHDREEFEVLGAKCWAEMESMRLKWEELMAKAGLLENGQ